MISCFRCPASLVLLTALCSCQGTIESADANGGNSTSALTCTEDAPNPGPAPIRRLTPLEYANSVQTIFGVTIDPSENFPIDGVVEGFDNNATSLSVTYDHVEAYYEVAENVASTIVSDANKRAELLAGCEPIEDACFDAVIRSMGRMVFRRPLNDEDVDALSSLTALADSAQPYDKLHLAISALLQSSQFIFRPEIGLSGDAIRPDLMRLNGFEIATRLSFLLWQSSPDAELLDAAESGELDSADGVEAHAVRMLNDPRSSLALQIFSRQWFDFRSLEAANFNDPDFLPAIQSSASEELGLLIDDYFETGTNLLNMFVSSHTYINQDLADWYGLQTSPGESFVRHDWGEGADRQGVFGTAGFLMLTAAQSENTVVHRGKFVREKVLCDPLPPPPPNVESNIPAPGEDPLVVVEQRAADPLCGSCHAAMDGVGLGLEQYDILGRERSEYTVENGAVVNNYPLPESGSFIESTASADAIDFKGAAELGSLVAESEATQRCVIEHYYRWGFGRSLHEADSCSLDARTKAFINSGGDFRAWLIDFVRSEAFLYRNPVEL